MTTTRQRAAAIEAFYAQHAQTLERAVAARVCATTPATIEDACQTAWATLMRRPDIDLNDGGLAWLTVVATHEGWRLASHAREVPAGALSAHPTDDEHATGEIPEPAGEATDPADRALDAERHRDRVARFARLKPAERQALLLKAAGYSYADIAALTEASYTAVNRRIAEGRARLLDHRAR